MKKNPQKNKTQHSRISLNFLVGEDTEILSGEIGNMYFVWMGVSVSVWKLIYIYIYIF